MKRIPALALCLCLLFTLFGCQNTKTPPEQTSPNVYDELLTDDGLRYLNEQRLDDIYLTENALHYSFVNETGNTLSVGPYTVTVEKWENGAWSFYPLLSGGAAEVAAILKPHSKSNYTRSIAPRQVSAGRYRLIEGYEAFSSNADGTIRITRSDKHRYRIGYFTVTEEQASAYPRLPEYLYYANGTHQCKDVSFSINNIEEHQLYHYQFRLQNNSDKVLTLKVTEAFAGYYSAGYMFRIQDNTLSYMSFYQEFPEGPVRIPPGETLSFFLKSNIAGSYLDLYELEDGSYRFDLPLHFDEADDIPFSAVLYFEIVDGNVKAD